MTAFVFNSYFNEGDKVDYFYRDQFYKPSDINLRLLDAEIAAGNVNAALIKIFLHIGRFGLEYILFGHDRAFEVIDAFLKRHPKEKSNPASMMALGLLQFIGVNDNEAVKFRKLNAIITPKLIDATLEFADAGSYFGRLLGSMALARGFGGGVNYPRAREVLEKIPGLPSDITYETAQSPGDELDPTVLYELALTYSSLAEKEDKKTYTEAEKLVFYRKSFLLALAAANLESAPAQHSVAEVYLQRSDDSPYFPEITDQNTRFTRAEDLFERALNQGIFSAKYGLAHIYAATNRSELAKVSYRELADKNESDALFDLILLHHRLGEYRQADENMMALVDRATATNRAYNGALDMLVEYTVGEGKPGLDRSELAQLKVLELILRRNRRRTITLLGPQIADLEGKARSLWERAWFDDKQKGLRRAARGRFPLYPVQVKNRSEALRWNKELAQFEKSADDLLKAESAAAFVFVPADARHALVFLIAEAQKPHAVISSDLATALFANGRFLINDANNLRCAERTDDIARNAPILVLLPDDPQQQHAALLAAATAVGISVSASLANELGRLATNLDETSVWQRRAAERGSFTDMRIFIDRYYLGDDSTLPNWIEALRWVRRALVTPPGRGGLKGVARREVETIETTILAEKTSAPPRLWIPDKDGLCPVTINASLDGAVIVPAAADEALAWYVAKAESGSPRAAQIAVDLHRQRGELDYVWIMDPRLGDLRLFAAGDDARQAVFMPREPSAAESFRTARNAAYEARSATEEARHSAAVGVTQEVVPESVELVTSEPDPVEILIRHVNAANKGSVPDALVAGAMFHSFGYDDDALVMYEIVVGSGISGALEVAERYMGIKPGAARNIELAFTLHRQLSTMRDGLNDANKTSLNVLREAVLEEAWVVTTAQVLRRVRRAVEEDLADVPDEALLVLPPNEDSMQRLLGQTYSSLDAAAEAALRLGKGIGVEQDLNQSFRILSDMLLDRRKIPSQDPRFIQTLPLDSPKRFELQQEWERQTLLLVETGELDDGSMEYVMQDSPLGAEPIIIPEAYIADFRILIAHGRHQALSQNTVG